MASTLIPIRAEVVFWVFHVGGKFSTKEDILATIVEGTPLHYFEHATYGGGHYSLDHIEVERVEPEER